MIRSSTSFLICLSGVLTTGCALSHLTADLDSGVGGSAGKSGGSAARHSGGAGNMGGQSPSAGTTSGDGSVAMAGTTSDGGTSAKGGTTGGGGVEVTGGVSAGGAAALGGGAAIGGSVTAAGNTWAGGTIGVGGDATIGGTTANGGTMSIEGAGGVAGNPVGGAAAGGGAMSTGGTAPIGGVTANGGAPSNGSTTTGGVLDGGVAGVAGQPSSGGTATGGAVTGGTPGTGGAAKCMINSVLYSDGTPNPGNHCQVCQSGVSTTAWVPLSEGASCDSGKVCSSGTCEAGCWIGSAYYPPGQNSTNKCQSCDPATSTTSWRTTLAEGDGCDTGQVCHNDICQPGCWIGATYRAADAANPNGLCQACKPGTSTTAWTSDPATCGCAGTLQSVQETTGLCVATMVPIPGPKIGMNYNIDSTEVTRKQYAMWLATTTATTLGTQDSATCGWNTDFAASTSCMTGSHVCTTNCDNHPQVCVDWCDAYAYCKGVGKRLCGKIGGGPNLYTDYASASLSEWYRACSSGGAYTYPYGNTYSATTCNGYNYWGSGSNTTLAVGTLSGCQATAPTSYGGVYDQSGNGWEWEDSCDSTMAGASASCRVRGGGFDVDYNSGYLHCDSGYNVSRNFVGYGPGLRCCSP
jgi:formylglycine-generating enzyme